MNASPQPESTQPALPEVTEERVREVLKWVVDPELRINIVDLGLVYEIRVAPPGRVAVRMTLTSPGCPYGVELLLETRLAVKSLRGVSEADVQLVWTPPWSEARVSEAARLDLGLI